MLKSVVYAAARLVIAFAPAVPVSAQSLIGLQAVGTQAPNAASLARPSEVNFGLYTGSAAIGLALGETSAGGLHLQYASSGLRVEQQSGWVGMGWSLNLGGVITRTVRGLPDEAPGGYLNAGSWLYDDAHFFGPYTGTTFTHLTEAASGKHDLSPDDIYVSVSGVSSRIQVLPLDRGGPRVPDARFRVMSFEGTRWVLRDGEGRDYVFEDTDMASSASSGGSIPPISSYVSSWYLSQIRDASGYVTARFRYNTQQLEMRRRRVDGRLYQYYEPNPGTTSDPGACDVGSLASSTSYINDDTEESLLQSVATLSDSLSFHTSLRSDFLNPTTGSPQARRLDSVRIYARSPSGTVGLVRRASFFYSYQGGSGGRLFLDSVVVRGPSGLERQSYRFGYTAGTLPSVESLAQDHWGYYNGADQNGTLIPPVREGGFNVGGANRTPDALSSRAGLLRTVAYPLGAVDTLDYEGNDFSYVGATPVGGYLTTKQASVGASMLGQPTDVPSATTTINLQSCWTGSEQNPNGPCVVSFHPTLSPICPSNQAYFWDSNQQQWVTCDRTLIVKNASGGVVYQNTNRALSDTLVLPKGVYTATATATQWNAAGLVVEWEAREPYSASRPGDTGPGQRVRRIVRYDPVTGTKLIRSFEYLRPNGSSSGALVSRPRYATIMLASYSQPSTGAAGVCHFAHVEASSTLPLGTTSGSPIGYSRVVERSSSGGWTEHLFESPSEEPDAPPILPGISYDISQDWRRGSETLLATFDAQGRALSRQRNTFEKLDEHFEDTRSFSIRLLAMPYGMSIGLYNPNYATYGWTRTLRSDVRLYSPSSTTVPPPTP